jgi:hypothetical protein
LSHSSFEASSDDYAIFGDSMTRPVYSEMLDTQQQDNPRWYWILLLLIPTMALYLKLVGWPPGLVDAHVYRSAVATWLGGKTPYHFNSTVNFLYPPVFLLALAAIRRAIVFHGFWPLYLTLHVCATLLLPWLLFRYFLQKRAWTLFGFYFLFFAAPGFLGILALWFGNIACICWAAMLAAAIYGLERNRWLLFYIAVFVCASIKITFLPVLLLPCLCGERQFLKSILCAASALAGLEAQALMFPSLFAQFREILALETTNMGDVGKGAFGIFFHLLHPLHVHGLVLPVAGYLIVVLLVLGMLLRLKHIYGDRQPDSWPALVLLGVLFIIPRVQFYDLCLGFPLAFILATRLLRIRRQLFLYAMLFLFSLPWFIWTRDRVFNGGYESLLIFVLFAISYRETAKLEVVSPKALPATTRPQSHSIYSVHESSV